MYREIHKQPLPFYVSFEKTYGSIKAKILPGNPLVSIR